jgi:hypothetical protein
MGIIIEVRTREEKDLDARVFLTLESSELIAISLVESF